MSSGKERWPQVGLYLEFTKITPTFLKISDGAGLFCGVLTHLLNRGRDCPKVLVASHFHEVFRKDLLDPHKFPITFVHMKVLFASSTGDVLDADGVCDSDSRQESSVSRAPAPGEKIMYLYR